MAKKHIMATIIASFFIMLFVRFLIEGAKVLQKNGKKE